MSAFLATSGEGAVPIFTSFGAEGSGFAAAGGEEDAADAEAVGSVDGFGSFAVSELGVSASLTARRSRLEESS